MVQIMAKSKVKRGNVRYDQNLLDRIDNMTDEKDFDPYQATKRRTISEQKAFDDSVYMDDNDDDDDVDEYGISTKTPAYVIILVIGFILAVLGALGYVLVKFL